MKMRQPTTLHGGFMSEHILRIPIEELAILRLICSNPNCGDATELTIDKLDRQHNGEVHCPSCDALLRTAHHSLAAPDVFDKFALAFRELKNAQSRYAQFVLPVKNGTPSSSSP
jgi:hypothetical protein